MPGPIPRPIRPRPIIPRPMCPRPIILPGPIRPGPKPRPGLAPPLGPAGCLAPPWGPLAWGPAGGSASTGVQNNQAAANKLPAVVNHTRERNMSWLPHWKGAAAPGRFLRTLGGNLRSHEGAGSLFLQTPAARTADCRTHCPKADVIVSKSRDISIIFYLDRHSPAYAHRTALRGEKKCFAKVLVGTRGAELTYGKSPEPDFLRTG